MANTTLAEAQDMLAKCKVAYENALNGQGYTYMNGGSSRTVTRQRIETLKAELNYWQGVVNRLDGTTPSRTKMVIPRDVR